jgi:hypothetical protein
VASAEREEKLPAPEASLLQLISEIGDYAIFLLDPDGNVMTWNRGAARMKGYAADEIVGRHFSAFYTAEDRARRHPAAELAVATEEGRFEEEGWRVRKDGSLFWANVVITRVADESGEVIAFGKVTRDLTARRAAEEKLRETAADLETTNATLRRFRMMVTGVRDYAIFMLDPSGHIATWNEGAERIKGYTPDEIVGEHYSRFFRPEDVSAGQPQAALAEAATTGRFEVEQWRRRKDGSLFWASVVLTAIRDDRGDLVGYAKVTRDLTERHTLEQELDRLASVASREVKELERFASTAAHDLQEPLRTVSGFAQVLSRRHGDLLPEDGQECLSGIESGIAQMSALVADLLTHARAARAEQVFEVVDLRAVAEGALETLRGSIQESGVEVELAVPPNAAVIGEAHGLRLVLQNLLSNAIKFAAKDGPKVQLAVDENGAQWLISVSDNGPGIPAEVRHRVFEPFVQLQPGKGGTGLGLAIVQRILERHDAVIDVESRAGGSGARFSFGLPRSG